MLEDETDAAVAHRYVRRILVAEIDVAAIGKFDATGHGLSPPRRRSYIWPADQRLAELSA